MFKAPETQEFPEQWGLCTIMIGHGSDNEPHRIQASMRIADLFVSRYGLVAKGDSEKVVLEPKTAGGAVITDLSEINSALKVIADEGFEVVFS